MKQRILKRIIETMVAASRNREIVLHYRLNKSIAFVKKLTKKIIISWLFAICVSGGIIQSV